ncbi:hypothetical protein C3K23_31410 [Streptomyces sp. 604F]|nr:hypothetical protein C3K23_31410 [Streptomyces sp. 604F]
MRGGWFRVVVVWWAVVQAVVKLSGKAARVGGLVWWVRWVGVWWGGWLCVVGRRMISSGPG